MSELLSSCQSRVDGIESVTTRVIKAPGHYQKDNTHFDTDGQDFLKPAEFLELDYSLLKPKEFLIIKDIVNIAEGIVFLINLVIDKKIDMIFFLDKSARPVYRVFLKVWQRVFPESPMPKIRFIEIGKDGPNSNKKIEQNIKRELRTRYGNLAGFNILIADEFVNTGKTLLKAKKILSKVFNPKKILYTGVFKKLPNWHGISHYIGVSEYDKIEKSNPHFLAKPYITQGARLFRKELDLLAVQISQAVNKIPKGNREFSPYLPIKLNSSPGIFFNLDRFFENIFITY